MSTQVASQNLSNLWIVVPLVVAERTDSSPPSGPILRAGRCRHPLLDNTRYCWVPSSIRTIEPSCPEAVVRHRLVDVWEILPLVERQRLLEWLGFPCHLYLFLLSRSPWRYRPSCPFLHLDCSLQLLSALLEPLPFVHNSSLDTAYFPFRSLRGCIDTSCENIPVLSGTVCKCDP